MVDDDRLPLLPGETPQMRKVRFRTLGCYPLSGAVESKPTRFPTSSPRCASPPPPSGRAVSSIATRLAPWRRRSARDTSHERPASRFRASDIARPHLRLGRRRQVDVDRATALREEAHLRRPAFRTQKDEKVRHDRYAIDFALLVDGLEAERSRASPSMSPIAISPPKRAPSSSPIHRVTSNIPATWRPAV